MLENSFCGLPPSLDLLCQVSQEGHYALQSSGRFVPTSTDEKAVPTESTNARLIRELVNGIGPEPDLPRSLHQQPWRNTDLDRQPPYSTPQIFVVIGCIINSPPKPPVSKIYRIHNPGICSWLHCSLLSAFVLRFEMAHTIDIILQHIPNTRKDPCAWNSCVFTRPTMDTPRLYEFDA